MPNPILSSPHPTPTRLTPLTPRHTRPSKPALPLLIAKKHSPFPAPNTHSLHPAHTPTHRPPKSALPLLITKKHSPFPAPNTHLPRSAHTPTHPPVKTGAHPPHIDASLSNLDTWGRVYFVHFLDILNTSPCVQNCKIYRYFSLRFFFFLKSSLALAIFPKTLLFAYISYPIFLLQSPRSHLFIGISLSDLDTWGRVCFVYFLDILNTSPCVQIRNVVLNVLGKRKGGAQKPRPVISGQKPQNATTHADSGGMTSLPSSSASPVNASLAFTSRACVWKQGL